jgi:hypothetical protein
VFGLSMALSLVLAPDPGAVVLDAPPGCPTAQDLHDRVMQQLGSANVDPEKVTFRARVREPETQGAPWSLQIEGAGAEVREIDGSSCDALIDAAAVMIAISLTARDPAVPEPPTPATREIDDRAAPPPSSTQGVVQQPRDASAQTTDEPTRPPPQAEPSTPATTLAQRWGRPRAVIGVATGVHGVGLPAVGAGLGGRLGARWGPLRAAAYGMHWFRRQRPVVGEVAAAYQLGVGGLEVCGVASLGRGRGSFEILGCGMGEAGVLRAEGVAAAPSLIRRHPWLGLGGGVAATWVPHPIVAAGLRADVIAPLSRFAFSIGDAAAGTVGPVDARGTLVIELRVPSGAR